MALNAYIADTQGLLHDTGASFYPVSLITGWVNDARQYVAQDAECIRIKPPNSGGVASFTIVSGGTSFSGTITVTLSAPQLVGGVQATATATQAGGVINAVTLGTAGSGYVIPPTVTITGSTGGSGANVTANLQSIVATVTNQEIYQYSTFNTFVQQTSGVQAIHAIKQIAVYWGNLKPPMIYKPWTHFNAYYRAWPQFSNFPSVWSQYGQGQNGSFYFWPIPSQVLGMDLDCVCVPITLATDSDPEAIPAPWTQCVKFRAAYRALLYAQRYDDAQTMLATYYQELRQSRASVMQSLVTEYP